MSVSLLELDTTSSTVALPHFPTTWQAVLWRNWGMIPPERLTRILQCTIAQLNQAAGQLGRSEADPACYELWQTRGYQTIIRQNWHLLSFEQILIALDWDWTQLKFTLKEDDFLWNKLGKAKPLTENPTFRELTATELAATSVLKEKYRNCQKNLLPAKAQPFDFLKTKMVFPLKPGSPDAPLRLIYSYSALYGDPLLDGGENLYPDQLLDEYAANGINALWIQAILYTLIPWFGKTSLSEHAEIRMTNLRRLAQRMSQRGIKLFLYLNEPRAMPQKVFTECCPDWIGASHRQGLFSPCTSLPTVRKALSSAITELFTRIPELGGFFAITMSENPTNCWSHTLFAPPTNCPCCLSRGQAPVIAELLNSMAEGAWQANPKAKIIAWNWGWEKSWDEQVIELLNPGITLMCVSETGLETQCQGIKGMIWDYSISKVGPGPWATRLWNKARTRGLKIMAKIQVNNSWECSAVPYLPVPGLVEKHLRKLSELGIRDLMLSWTLGGYPGGNLKLLKKSVEDSTKQDFGAAADLVLQAFHRFDEAFSQFPFHMVNQIYYGPQNFGPLNQLYPTPTGQRATMLGFPYDDLELWSGNGHYPEGVFESQFQQISDIWQEGLKLLVAAAPLLPAASQLIFEDLRSVSETVYCHFRSSYLQIAFIRRRHLGLKKVQPLLEEEIRLALQMVNLCRKDSRLGFEAGNHYYYTENTLLEKVFNCCYLLENI
ncbi:MAG: hypothetical protein WCT05_13250 [Lentisphaeria bacterium]